MSVFIREALARENKEYQLAIMDGQSFHFNTTKPQHYIVLPRILVKGLT